MQTTKLLVADEVAVNNDNALDRHLAIQLTGSGVVVFEVSVDGVNWTLGNARVLDGSGWTDTPTVPGMYIADPFFGSGPPVAGPGTRGLMWRVRFISGVGVTVIFQPVRAS